MGKKKALKKLVIVIAVLLLAVAVITFVFDPFYQYHGPLVGEEVLYDRDYQMAGSIRNLNYDSVILGSSVAENFDGDFLEEQYGGEVIKIIRASGSTADLLYYLEQARYEQEVKRVFWCMDVFALTADTEVTANTDRSMKYLHTKTMLDDATYLFNKDVLLKKIPLSLAYAVMNRNVSGAAYNWAADKDFSAGGAMRAYQKPEQILEEQECREEMARLGQNQTLILEEIENNPQTEYIIIFPPYSMMWWDCGYTNGIGHMYLQVLEETVPMLLGQENVRVYFFTDEKEIICNLDNYMDMIHYAPRVNQYMLECVISETKQVTEENVDDVLENMQKVYQYIVEEGIYKYYPKTAAASSSEQ